MAATPCAVGNASCKKGSKPNTICYTKAVKELILTLPDELAERVAPLRYLPVILEVSLLTLKTPAAQSASELIEFLGSNPTSQAVLEYHGSEQTQKRIQQLLELNHVGLISEADARELDEHLLLEHLVVMLKAGLPHEVVDV